MSYMKSQGDNLSVSLNFQGFNQWTFNLNLDENVGNAGILILDGAKATRQTPDEEYRLRLFKGNIAGYTGYNDVGITLKKEGIHGVVRLQNTRYDIISLKTIIRDAPDDLVAIVEKPYSTGSQGSLPLLPPCDDAIFELLVFVDHTVFEDLQLSYDEVKSEIESGFSEMANNVFSFDPEGIFLQIDVIDVIAISSDNDFDFIPGTSNATLDFNFAALFNKFRFMYEDCAIESGVPLPDGLFLFHREPNSAAGYALRGKLCLDPFVPSTPPVVNFPNMPIGVSYDFIGVDNNLTLAHEFSHMLGLDHLCDAKSGCEQGQGSTSCEGLPPNANCDNSCVGCIECNCLECV
jgi:hypothetical protein